MVVMLSILLLVFNRESRANLYAVEDFRKSAQALNCARAGLNIAIAAAGDFSEISFDTPRSVLTGRCRICSRVKTRSLWIKANA
jgi:hypothetical protein